MRRRFMRILCGLFIAFLLVRLIAPIVQEWQWKWGTIYAERADARRDIVKQLNRVTVEDFTSSLPGALAAAITCKDDDLARRAQKAWVAHVKKGTKGVEKKLAAEIAAEVLKSGGVATQFQFILTRNCRASLRQAALTVARAEQKAPHTR